MEVLERKWTRVLTWVRSPLQNSGNTVSTSRLQIRVSTRSQGLRDSPPFRTGTAVRCLLLIRISDSIVHLPVTPMSIPAILPSRTWQTMLCPTNSHILMRETVITISNSSFIISGNISSNMFTDRIIPLLASIIRTRGRHIRGTADSNSVELTERFIPNCCCYLKQSSVCAENWFSNEGTIASLKKISAVFVSVRYVYSLAWFNLIKWYSSNCKELIRKTFVCLL